MNETSEHEHREDVISAADASGVSSIVVQLSSKRPRQAGEEENERSALRRRYNDDPKAFMEVASESISWWQLFAHQHPWITEWLTSSLAAVWAMSVDAWLSCRPAVQLGTLFVDHYFQGVQFSDAQGIVRLIPMSLRTFYDTHGFPYLSWVADLTPEMDYFQSLIPSDLPVDTQVIPFPLDGHSPGDLAGSQLCAHFLPGVTQIRALLHGFMMVELAFNHLPWLHSSLRDISGGRLSWNVFIQNLFTRTLFTGISSLVSAGLSVVGVHMLSLHPTTASLRLLVMLSSTLSTIAGRQINRCLISSTEIKESPSPSSSSSTFVSLEPDSSLPPLLSNP